MTRVESASTEKVENLDGEVNRILRVMASIFKEPDETEEDWLAYCFVSDDSSIGDFVYLDAELSQLRNGLGIPDVLRSDSIVEVAALLRSKERPA